MRWDGGEDAYKAYEFIVAAVIRLFIVSWTRDSRDEGSDVPESLHETRANHFKVPTLLKVRYFQGKRRSF